MTPLLKIKKVKGIEYYIARGYIDGKRRDKSVGRVDRMTLTQAKLAAVRAFEAAEEKTSGPTFADVLPAAMADIASVKRWKNGRSETQWRQSINDYALPFLGDKEVAGITTDDVLEVLRPIWLRRTETAKRLRARIEAVIDWCTVKKLRSGANPASWKGNLALLLPSPSQVAKVEHQEAPTMEEMQKLVRYCRLHPSPASALFLFTAATVVRNTEARLMKMDEVNGDVWTVPAQRMKTKQAGDFRVPLSSLALEALKQASPEGYAFCARSSSPLTIDTVRLKMCEILHRKITLHGVRSAFRDWAAREGVDHAVAEKCLSHVWGNQTTQAYFRDDLLEQRRSVLQNWADAIASSS